VANQTVSFALSDPTGGTLSAASGVTNSQGAVSVIYQATSTPSANNGVVVTATVDPPGAPPPFSATATITVGGQALFISLGTGNSITEPTSTTYALPFTAVVTDAAGNPAPPNTVFRLSVVSVAYQRGAFGDCPPAPWDPIYTVPGPGLTSNFGAGCPSEDVNQNGILNAGEDTNNNGRLEPGNVVSVPSTVDLDEDGVAQFLLTYPQDRAFWVEITLRATASVAGSESVEEVTFVLEGLASDYNNCDVSPPGAISPYGTGSTCDSTENAECSDGADNDGDGDIDSNDLSCDSVLDNNEGLPAECSDTFDNDGDGKIDSADPDCTDANDNAEQATTICSDTIDNDGDGQIDSRSMAAARVSSIRRRIRTRSARMVSTTTWTA
jgi:adhesin/invasin